MEIETDYAKDFHGFNMTVMQIFGLGPMFTITCWKCGVTFKRRIPLVNNPGIQCTSCNSINIISVVVD